jgi:hypothetical protein
MTARLGNVLFWASIGVAAFSLYDVYGPDGELNPREDLTGFVVAAVIVLIGWAFRYILARRST